MQKKALIIHLIILTLTMILGASLKVSGQSEFRSLHRYSGLIALVAGLIAFFVFLNTKASRKQICITAAAFLSTLAASIGGNLTKTAQDSFGYGLMVVAFLCAWILVAYNLYTSRSAPLKSE